MKRSLECEQTQRVVQLYLTELSEGKPWRDLSELTARVSKRVLVPKCRRRGLLNMYDDRGKARGQICRRVTALHA